MKKAQQIVSCALIYIPRYAAFTSGSDLSDSALPSFTIRPVSRTYPLSATSRARFAFCSTNRIVVLSF